jgi:hypothetical protein
MLSVCKIFLRYNECIINGRNIISYFQHKRLRTDEMLNIEKYNFIFHLKLYENIYLVLNIFFLLIFYTSIHKYLLTYIVLSNFKPSSSCKFH